MPPLRPASHRAERYVKGTLVIVLRNKIIKRLYSAIII